MNRIEILNLTKLHNNEHYQFMTDVDALILKCVASELGINDTYPLFKQALTAEESALRAENGSSRSEALAALDVNRDQTTNAISLRVKSALLSPIADEVASAKALQRIIDQYGDVRSLPYNEESAALTNMVNDLQKPENSVHLEKVCIQTWVPILKQENDDFIALFNERNEELSGRDSGNVRAARLKLDPLYREMMDTINASFIVKLAKPIAASFVSQLNEKIKYYETSLATRRSNKKDDGKTDTTSSK